MRKLVQSLVLASGCALTLAHPLATLAPVVDANTHPVYAALRTLGVGSEAYQVKGLVLHKDAAAFTLNGTLHLLPEVAGRITGAVFLGQGTMAYTPPIASERAMLFNLTRADEFNETFERAVFRFTDDTVAAIKTAGSAATGLRPSQAQDALDDVNQALRYRIKDNLDARILQDVLSPGSAGFFRAYIAGKKYSNKLVYIVDPLGAGDVAPEEVELLSWADNKEGIFAAHHLSEFYRTRQQEAVTPGSWIDIEHHTIRADIAPSGELTGTAAADAVAQMDGLAVVPFSLFPTLRVSSVTAGDGTALAFIQEAKDENADYWVVLPKPLRKGERFTIGTVYQGRDAISAEGSDNFYPIARSNWYPNNTGIKDYATYDLTFSVHKRMRLVATGDLVSETIEGDKSVSQWRSSEPMSVAGFNLGLFKRDEAKVAGFTVVALANETPSNMIATMSKQLPIGSFDTAAANKTALTEAMLALQVFADFFGPISITRVHMTQQTACNYGQAWPGVIYIPTCYYWNATMRQQLGIQQGNSGYWDSVAAHEVAHLWWGHALGWNSYRDQWMSEGFSNFSASLFLQAAYAKEPQRFHKFWNDMREQLTEKNASGFRPIDVGPLTQGYRLNSGRTGSVGADLIYPKGAYVLHMLRMMMWNRDGGDAKFKAMLKDFVASRRNRPVTTADFKAVVDRHMTSEMNIGGTGTMDWFFDEYVYGTQLPAYKLQQSVATANGQTVVHIKITQSGVSDGFRMLVPIYVELRDGRVLRLGTAGITGNKTIEQDVPLGQMAVKRALLNHNQDVLAIVDQ